MQQDEHVWMWRQHRRYLMGFLAGIAEIGAPMTPLMKEAENAAKIVASWSNSKREYAKRIVGGHQQLKPAEGK